MTFPGEPVPLTRRKFLFRTGTLLAASHAALSSAGEANSNPVPKPLVGSGFYGWTQYYQRDGKDPNQYLDEIFAAVRDSGFDFVEGFIDVAQPEKNLRLAERMRAKGLKLSPIYTGARLHEESQVAAEITRLITAARSCREAGFSVIDINPNPIGRDKTPEELKTQVKALNQLGEEFKKLGLKLGVHNHLPEMANGAREFHSDLRNTNPDFVGLCYDVDWVNRGGLQPLDCLREYGSRVVAWHIRQSRDKVWLQDLDQGDIDYRAIAKFNQEHRLTAPYSVELAIEKGTKIDRSVVENHKRSREFMRAIFGC